MVLPFSLVQGVLLGVLSASVGSPSSPLAEAPTEGVLQVLVRDQDRLRLLDEVWTPERRVGIPLPALTRSPRVRRAVVDDGVVTVHLTSGVGTDLELDAVEVRWIRHESDEQVLVARDSIHLVGSPRLPRRVRAGSGLDLLPLLARQDGVEASLHGAVLVPPDSPSGTLRAIAIHRDAVHQESRAGIGSRTVTIADSPAALIETVGAPVDQVFFAEVSPAEVSRSTLALRGASFRSALEDLLDMISPAQRARFESEREGRPDDELPTDWRDRALASYPGLSDPARALRERDDRILVLGSTVSLVLEFELPRELEEGAWTLLVEPVVKGAIAADREHWTLGIGGHPAPSPARFAPRTASSGLGDFVHFEGPDLQLDIRPTMGPGLAAGDFDADGDLDLYLVQGGGREGSAPVRNRLFRNQAARQGMSFVDVTESSGAGDTGAGMGALFFDPDGDGDLDLFVANYGADVLYTNDGTGRFTEVTEAVGITGDRWSAGAAAADTDLDGDLDLFVTSYLRYDEDEMPTDVGAGRYRREDPIAMLPFAFPGEGNAFWRNELVSRSGDGGGSLRFTDAAEELGLVDEDGRGMQPVFWDFDRDGDPDLYVANDVSLNRLYRNEGDGTFSDVSFTTGMDDPRGGMGVTIGDVEGDGDEDLFLTNWELEPNGLYLNNLVTHRSRKTYIPSFRDTVVKSGLGRWGVGATSWGAELFDADLDGDLDLFVANGYTSPDYESTGICVGQPNHLFHGDGSGRFALAEDEEVFERALPSRSALAADFDRDGDLDLVVTSNNGPVELFENRTEAGPERRWLGVGLRARGANSFAIGAEVTVHAGERLHRRSLRAGGSYLAGNPPELHFGLGAHAGPVTLEVRWPSGATSTHEVDETSRWITLEEPE